MEEARPEAGAVRSGLRSRVPNFAWEFIISVGDLARVGKLLGFEAIREDTRLVFPGPAGFLEGEAGVGKGYSRLSCPSLVVEVVTMVEWRRRGAVSPRIKFICSLSSELDSDSSPSSSFMLSGRDTEESPDADCCLSRLRENGNVEQWKAR